MGALALRSSRLRPLPSEGLKVLSGREYSVVCALAEALIPNRPQWPTVEEVRVGVLADLTIERLSEDAQKEIKQLLGLFENGLTQFLFSGRTRPFSQMNSQEQQDALRSWQTSGLTLRRTGFQALRTLVMACYYGSERIWPMVGYPGPPIAIPSGNQEAP